MSVLTITVVRRTAKGVRIFFTGIAHRHLLAAAEVHQMRRGNKCAAAHFLRMILAKDDHARTMHAYAKRGERQQSGETPGANTSPLNAPRRRGAPRSVPCSGTRPASADASRRAAAPR